MHAEALPPLLADVPAGLAPGRRLPGAPRQVAGSLDTGSHIAASLLIKIEFLRRFVFSKLETAK